MKRNKLLYANYVDKTILETIFSNFSWSYDIPGCITLDNFIYLIKNNFIIHKDDHLGKHTIMDADNYYVQSGDMSNICNLFNLL